jgi:hypothetical protein
MAHYAFIDDQNVVVEVIVGHDEGHQGVDWEAYYASVHGLTCRRTSYNTRDGVHLYGGKPFRGTYAAIGYTFDASRGPDGEFVPPQE